MGRKKSKIRAEFRKNREIRTRRKDLTRNFDSGHLDEDLLERSERISGKGALTRKRTVAGADTHENESGTQILPEIDHDAWLAGRVLRVQGLISHVHTDAGQTYPCATRRLLKTLATDQRHVVAVGDRVWIRPAGDLEGIIERVEPRYGALCRTSRGRQHVIVANVDQIVIVSSSAEPRLKRNLIDRYLVTAEQSEIEPVICINKLDLIDPAGLQPLVGVYAQLGYRVLMVSAKTGLNVPLLKQLLDGRQSVVTGQSGVGKSSLLNAIDPALQLRVQSVSSETEKGRHTTSNAEMIPLHGGGFVIDTPGIRQFQLWDIIAEELPSLFPELRPFVSRCKYPDCTHAHEDACAVKDAVADGMIDTRRYESYLQMLTGESF